MEKFNIKAKAGREQTRSVCLRLANNTIFVPALFCRINARVDIAFKCNYKCANFKKTRIFEQSRNFIEGKWREQKEMARSYQKYCGCDAYRDV